ncbi:Uncharacterised protein [Vibrio cholerae]|nr:Uncharacterised protein [Vibrio cholerae]
MLQHQHIMFPQALLLSMHINKEIGVSGVEVDNRNML